MTNQLLTNVPHYGPVIVILFDILLLFIINRKQSVRVKGLAVYVILRMLYYNAIKSSVPQKINEIVFVIKNSTNSFIGIHFLLMFVLFR